MSSFTSRCAMAPLLAFSTKKVFPQTVLLGGGPLSFGFYYDFIFEHSFTDTMLTWIEESMSGLLKESESWRAYEMMTENACQLLYHLKSDERAEQLRDRKETTVSMVQHGKFSDWTEYSLEGSVLENNAIKIWKHVNFERETNTHTSQGTRIYGFWAPNGKLLREKVKQWKAGASYDHVTMGTRTELFYSWNTNLNTHWAWLEKGLALQNQLLSIWHDTHKNEGVQIVKTMFPPLSDAETLLMNHKQMIEEKGNDSTIAYGEWVYERVRGGDHGNWGVMGSEWQLCDYVHLFCKTEELQKNCISSLQFMNKIVMMFGLDIRWIFYKDIGTPSKERKEVTSILEHVLSNEKISYETEFVSNPSFLLRATWVDSFGREWDGSWIKMHSMQHKGLKKEKWWILQRSLFVSLEYWCAVVLEHYRGNIPKWITTGKKERIEIESK